MVRVRGEEVNLRAVNPSSYLNNPNISNQTFHLKEFLRTEPFSIIQCDKNIGSANVSHNLLDQLCVNHLMNKLL